LTAPISNNHPVSAVVNEMLLSPIGYFARHIRDQISRVSMTLLPSATGLMGYSEGRS
jgi:hypothetical protein